MKTVVRTEKLTKRFGDLTAVDGIDLDVHEGEVFGFLGPNGAGKTTTLRLLCALIAPTSGTAEIAGRRKNGARVHRRAARRRTDRLPLHAQPGRGRSPLRPHRLLPASRAPDRQPGRAARRVLRPRDRDPSRAKAEGRGSRPRAGGARRARGTS